MERSSADRRLNGRHKTAARSRVGNGTPKSAQRSRITNGSALVLGDNRSAWARRAKDIIAAFIVDLGGIENCSVAELSLVRRCAALTTELELLETIFSNVGRATSDQLDLYARVAGHLRRLLETLGIKRRARDITPSVTDYLRTKHGVAS